MAMDERTRLAYLAELGIDVYLPRVAAESRAPAEVGASDVARGIVLDAAAVETDSVGTAARCGTASTESAGEAAIPAGSTQSVDTLAWPELRTRVGACSACALRAGCQQTVFGVGDTQAHWMLIGEAPGADEDRLGEPFVGRAGQLLDSMLFAMGLRRESVFIANILKCRPPNNRDPKPEEVAACEPFLHRQVALVRPRLILALGRIAAQNLLKTDTPIGKLRGRVHRYGEDDIPLVVTYHPAYLLRSPLEKRKAWDDLKLAQKTDREGSV